MNPEITPNINTTYSEYYLRHPLINLTPTLIKALIPKLIGRNGAKFKWIRQMSGLNHIWYNDRPYYNQQTGLVNDASWGFIQLWGTPESITLAIQYLDYYIFQLVEMEKIDKQKYD